MYIYIYIYIYILGAALERALGCDDSSKRMCMYVCIYIYTHIHIIYMYIYIGSALERALGCADATELWVFSDGVVADRVHVLQKLQALRHQHKDAVPIHTVSSTPSIVGLFCPYSRFLLTRVEPGGFRLVDRWARLYARCIQL